MAAEHVGPEQRGMPSHRRAPVMADDDGLLLPKRRDQRDHVADGIENAVSGDVGGGAGPAESPHVGYNDPEARLRERLDLVPPRIG